jgi:hypothetical protein
MRQDRRIKTVAAVPPGKQPFDVFAVKLVGQLFRVGTGGDFQLQQELDEVAALFPRLFAVGVELFVGDDASATQIPVVFAFLINARLVGNQTTLREVQVKFHHAVVDEQHAGLAGLEKAEQQLGRMNLIKVPFDIRRFQFLQPASVVVPFFMRKILGTCRFFVKRRLLANPLWSDIDD